MRADVNDEKERNIKRTTVAAGTALRKSLVAFVPAWGKDMQACFGILAISTLVTNDAGSLDKRRASFDFAQDEVHRVFRRDPVNC